MGPDPICHKFLKMVKTSIAQRLTIPLDKILIDMKFSRKWKQSVVYPLFKKGDKSFTSIYRPISSLSCIGKLMERCVYKHVYNYLFSNQLINNKQSGFLTVHQLLEIHHHVVRLLDAKQNTCMVFCDISKAFDRVWNMGLIYKLHQLGVIGHLLYSFTDYLTISHR